MNLTREKTSSVGTDIHGYEVKYVEFHEMMHRDIATGNDYRKERIKHIITLATGVFALTVTFHKDFFETKDAASGLVLLFIGWGLLLISLLLGILHFRAWEDFYLSYRKDAQVMWSYFVGSKTEMLSTFAKDDFKDLDAFAAKFVSPSRPIDVWLKSQFPAGVQSNLTDYKNSPKKRAEFEKGVIDQLNSTLKSALIFDEKRFEGVTLRADARALSATNPKDQELQRLNRLLLEDAYSLDLARNQKERAEFRAGRDIAVAEARRKKQVKRFKIWDVCQTLFLILGLACIAAYVGLSAESWLQERSRATAAGSQSKTSPSTGTNGLVPQNKP
jgi:hypothetical protein